MANQLHLLEGALLCNQATRVGRLRTVVHAGPNEDHVCNQAFGCPSMPNPVRNSIRFHDGFLLSPLAWNIPLDIPKASVTAESITLRQDFHQSDELAHGLRSFRLSSRI